tara:strand:+ start:3997 stop:4530 length:534 start_codon:yes stop_codon:yes gene_type:complete
MKISLSPANLISLLGFFLSVVGLAAFFTNAVNLSVPTFFYGVPILLIGLALKTSELKPVLFLSEKSFNDNDQERPLELTSLIKDVTKWHYGQTVHLASSLEALNLWDEINPPELIEIEEIKSEGKKGLRLKFIINNVPFEIWQSKKDRLERFFSKGLEIDLVLDDNKDKIDLILFYK